MGTTGRLRVTLIGTGRISDAIEALIQRGDSQATVRVWGRKHGTPVSGAVGNSDVIFLCIPSYAVREVLTNCQRTIPKSALVVTIAKGIEHATGKTMDQVLTEMLPAGQPSAVLGGPTLAEELLAGKNGIGVVGSASPNAFKLLHELFGGTSLLLERGASTRSVTLAGVVKNVYAMSVGIGYGLGWSEAECLSFRQRALEEMLRVGERLGIDQATLHGPAGVGDFITTASSPHSRNRRAGEQLGRSGQLDQQAESIASFHHFLHRVARKNDLAILQALVKILVDRQPVSDIWPSFRQSVAASL